MSRKFFIISNDSKESFDSDFSIFDEVEVDTKFSGSNASINNTSTTNYKQRKPSIVKVSVKNADYDSVSYTNQYKNENVNVNSCMTNGSSGSNGSNSFNSANSTLSSVTTVENSNMSTPISEYSFQNGISKDYIFHQPNFGGANVDDFRSPKDAKPIFKNFSFSGTKLSKYPSSLTLNSGKEIRGHKKRFSLSTSSDRFSFETPTETAAGYTSQNSIFATSNNYNNNKIDADCGSIATSGTSRKLSEAKLSIKSKKPHSPLRLKFGVNLHRGGSNLCNSDFPKDDSGIITNSSLKVYSQSRV